jgi:hypothetical protein
MKTLYGSWLPPSLSPNPCSFSNSSMSLVAGQSHLPGVGAQTILHPERITGNTWDERHDMFQSHTHACTKFHLPSASICEKLHNPLRLVMPLKCMLKVKVSTFLLHCVQNHQFWNCLNTLIVCEIVLFPAFGQLPVTICLHQGI